MTRTTAVFVFVVVSAFPQAVSNRGYVRKGGFAPKATVALGIADAVLVPVYGKKVIDSIARSRQ